jgi:hypothetical protein
MTALFVGFPFDVAGHLEPLRVRRSLLGRQYHFVRDGVDVQISIPQRHDDFLYWTPFVPGEYRALIDWNADSDEVSIYTVFVAVGFDATVSAANSLEGDTLDAAIAVVDHAYAVAQAVIDEFLSWIRATTRMTGQVLSGQTAALAGPARAMDVELGLPIGVGPTHHGVAVARDPAGKYVLDETDLDDLITRIARHDEAPVAETLLADAEYYARHMVNDVRRAILMAAIACEVKVKEVLRGRASPETLPLIDFALENPREITVSVAGGLFHKLMRTAHGRSLSDENNVLFHRIERLFTVRNSIAHRGVLPDAVETRQLVAAARQCFQWLDM